MQAAAAGSRRRASPNRSRARATSCRSSAVTGRHPGRAHRRSRARRRLTAIAAAASSSAITTATTRRAGRAVRGPPSAARSQHRRRVDDLGVRAAAGPDWRSAPRAEPVRADGRHGRAGGTAEAGATERPQLDAARRGVVARRAELAVGPGVLARPGLPERPVRVGRRGQPRRTPGPGSGTGCRAGSRRSRSGRRTPARRARCRCVCQPPWLSSAYPVEGVDAAGAQQRPAPVREVDRHDRAGAWRCSGSPAVAQPMRERHRGRNCQRRSARPPRSRPAAVVAARAADHPPGTGERRTRHGERPAGWPVWVSAAGPELAAAGRCAATAGSPRWRAPRRRHGQRGTGADQADSRPPPGAAGLAAYRC